MAKQGTAAKQTEEASESTRPQAKFSGSGGISVAVWKQKGENGQQDHYSIRMDRTFKNGAGQYESSPYLRENDVLRAIAVLQSADAWIEQDRAKFRSGQGQERASGRQ